MKEVHEIRVVKGTSQTVAEAVELVVMTGIMFYLFRPDLRVKHTAFIHAKIQAVAYWVSIQHTIASIRNLPETGQM